MPHLCNSFSAKLGDPQSADQHELVRDIQQSGWWNKHPGKAAVGCPAKLNVYAQKADCVFFVCKTMLALLQEKTGQDPGGCSSQPPPLQHEHPPMTEEELRGFQASLIGYLQVENCCCCVLNWVEWMQVVKPKNRGSKRRENREPEGSCSVPEAPQQEEPTHHDGWAPVPRGTVFWGLSTAAAVAVGMVLLRVFRRWHPSRIACWGGLYSNFEYCSGGKGISGKAQWKTELWQLCTLRNVV